MEEDPNLGWKGNVQEQPSNRQGKNLPRTGNCWNTSITVQLDVFYITIDWEGAKACAQKSILWARLKMADAHVDKQMSPGEKFSSQTRRFVVVGKRLKTLEA